MFDNKKFKDNLIEKLGLNKHKDEYNELELLIEESLSLFIKKIEESQDKRGLHQNHEFMKEMAYQVYSGILNQDSGNTLYTIKVEHKEAIETVQISQLDLVISSNHTGLVKHIINKGAKVGKLEVFGSHISMAINLGNIELVKVLIDNEIEINKVDSAGYYPIEYAIMNNNLEITKLLLKKGANPNLESDFGILNMVLINKGYSEDRKIEFLKLLIEHGGNVNQLQGLHISSSLLHTAISNKEYKIIKFLLNNNADLAIKNKFSEAAYDLYSQIKDLELYNIFKTAYLQAYNPQDIHQNNNQYVGLNDLSVIGALEELRLDESVN